LLHDLIQQRRTEEPGAAIGSLRAFQGAAPAAKKPAGISVSDAGIFFRDILSEGCHEDDVALVKAGMPVDAAD